MGLARRIERLLPDLGVIIARFPISAAISLLLCLYLNADLIAGHSSFDDDMISAGSAAFLASGAAHLFAEARKLSTAYAVALAVSAGLAAAVFGLFTGIFQTSLLLLFSGLGLALMVAGFLRSGATQGALWLFNLRLGLAALLATIVAGLFAGGLSAIVEALKFLFGVPLPNNLHEHIWATAASLIAPLYGLSLLAKDIDEEVRIAEQKNTVIERGVSVLVNFVLVPIIIIYALILHAYAIKIALQWELPKGQIGTMVSIFALGGTGAWLVAWPWRDSGTRLLRLFMGGWFWLTIVPAALLVIAISRRLGEYGVTPDRYGLILVAIWLVLLALYLAIRRNRADMRAIIGGLAVLLLGGSLGPWGANGLTISSQFGRLTALMLTHGLLKEGHVVQPAPSVAPEVRQDGYSMIDILRETGGLKLLRPWFQGMEKDPFADNAESWNLASNISEAIGFTAYAPPPNYVNFTATTAESRELPAAARLIGPIQVFPYPPGPPVRGVSAEIKDGALTLIVEGKSWVLPLGSFLAQAKVGVVAPGQPQPPFMFPAGSGMTLIVDSLSGEMGERPQLHSARFWIILQR